MTVCFFKELQTLVVFCQREIGLFIFTFEQSRFLAEGILTRADMHLLGELPLKKKVRFIVNLIIFLDHWLGSHKQMIAAQEILVLLWLISLNKALRNFLLALAPLLFLMLMGFLVLLNASKTYGRIWGVRSNHPIDFFPYITIKTCSFFEYHFNRYPEKWSYFWEVVSNHNTSQTKNKFPLCQTPS